ncbi:MAG: hypothetical protein JRF61_12655 [Deltaproteobacteria bacterium]|jgi:hypothetical protein|nr:hypothetical protein [Deltaproteobacteria bacterium]
MSRRPRSTLLTLALVAAAAAGLVLALRWSVTPPGGAVEPAWDRDACARCRMLVSDPRFASQRQLANGEILHFDDPGCLLLHRHAHPAPERGVYLHEHRGEGWISLDEAAFVVEEPSPMGYGLAAVSRDETGAMSVDEALASVLTHDAGRLASPPDRGSETRPAEAQPQHPAGHAAPHDGRVP